MYYKWECINCGATEDVERPMAQHAVGPTAACSSCSQVDWRRVFESPMIMNAALPDGTRRAGFALEKEASKLDVQAASAKPKQATELRNEAKKLRSINAKGS